MAGCGILGGQYGTGLFCSWTVVGPARGEQGLAREGGDHGFSLDPPMA